jgi:hypothetical protein
LPVSLTTAPAHGGIAATPSHARSLVSADTGAEERFGQVLQSAQDAEPSGQGAGGLVAGGRSVPLVVGARTTPSVPTAGPAAAPAIPGAGVSPKAGSVKGPKGDRQPVAPGRGPRAERDQCVATAAPALIVPVPVTPIPVGFAPDGPAPVGTVAGGTVTGGTGAGGSGAGGSGAGGSGADGSVAGRFGPVEPALARAEPLGSAAVGSASGEVPPVGAGQDGPSAGPPAALTLPPAGSTTVVSAASVGATQPVATGPGRDGAKGDKATGAGTAPVAGGLGLGRQPSPASDAGAAASVGPVSDVSGQASDAGGSASSELGRKNGVRGTEAASSAAPQSTDPTMPLALTAAAPTVSTMPASVPAAAVTAPPPAGVPTPAAQLSPTLMTLAKTADGNQQMTVRLHPADLGMVQVRIETTASGSTQVQITAEKTDTLQALLRDQTQLHRTLDEAGIPAAGRSVTFHVAQTVPTPAAQAAAGSSSSDHGAGQSAPGGRFGGGVGNGGAGNGGAGNTDANAGSSGGGRTAYPTRDANTESGGRRQGGLSVAADAHSSVTSRTYRVGLDITA